MMKKILSLLLALMMVLSLAACGGNSDADAGADNDADSAVEDGADAGTEDEAGQTDPDADADAGAETSLGQTLAADFLAQMEADPDAAPLDVANALITSPAILFSGMAMEMEPGFFPGFTVEITDFAQCATFAPMINAIAFVGYVFTLDEGADVDAFVATLKENSDPRWNICVEAEETVVEVVGNTVFFVMCPKTLEE